MGRTLIEAGGTFQGQVNADTIEIHGRRIRLHGVDAPERGQPCFMPNGAPWRCGQEGALALSDFLGATVVSCVGVDTDRYGRMVADCTANDRDISAWLVSEGWAMAYRRYSTAHVDAAERHPRDPVSEQIAPGFDAPGPMTISVSIMAMQHDRNFIHSRHPRVSPRRPLSHSHTNEARMRKEDKGRWGYGYR